MRHALNIGAKMRRQIANRIRQPSPPHGGRAKDSDAAVIQRVESDLRRIEKCVACVHLVCRSRRRRSTPTGGEVEWSGNVARSIMAVAWQRHRQICGNAATFRRQPTGVRLPIGLTRRNKIGTRSDGTTVTGTKAAGTPSPETALRGVTWNDTQAHRTIVDKTDSVNFNVTVPTQTAR